MGPILAHQTAKFKLSGQFRFSRHPWGPQSIGVICIWKKYQLFCDSGAALADFFIYMKMLPNVSFICMVIKKVFLSLSIATISTFLQKYTLWRHNFETSQPKIGQCVSGFSYYHFQVKIFSWKKEEKIHHCGAINYFLGYRYSRMNGEQIHNPGSKFALTGKIPESR